MSNLMEGKRIPAGKRNKKIICKSVVGYGKNIIEGKFGLNDVAHGKKRAPLSTELTTGVEITASSGGNPNRQTESR